MKYKYVIDGDPIPWKRPAGTIRRYDSQKREKAQMEWILLEQKANQRQPILRGPLKMVATFYIKTPKNKPHLEGKYAPVVPDNSNMLKLIEDVGNQLLYLDDKQLVITHQEKYYDSKPRTEFTLEELEG